MLALANERLSSAGLGHHVIGVDTSADKVAALRAGRSPIADAQLGSILADAFAAGRLMATSDAAEAVADTDISFISVGTPGKPAGQPVAAGGRSGERARSAGRSAARPWWHSVVMRSTVPPGTAEGRAIPILQRESGRRLGDGWHYYSNPEFLREGSSVAGFQRAANSSLLIGTAPGDDAAALRELYGEIAAPIHVVPYRIAESVKYLGNLYHAVKIAFANEAGGVLAAYGVDAREVFSACFTKTGCSTSRPPISARASPSAAPACLRICAAFWPWPRRPGCPRPSWPSCCPASRRRSSSGAVAAVVARGRQRVGLFGFLAFKPGTDDLRESPFVTLAERLLARGFELSIFDRSVEMARLTGGNRAYIEQEIPHLEGLMVGTPAEALAGSAIAIIGHVGAADRLALIDGLTDQFVLDLAGLPELERRPGISYQSLYGEALA